MSPLRLITVLLFMLMIKQGGAQNNVLTFTAYPNPYCDVVHIQFFLVRDDTITLEMYDLAGTKVLIICSNQPFPHGPFIISLINDTLPDGAYIIRLASVDSPALSLHITKQSGCETGINTIIPSPKLITLYPNPTSNSITIDIEGEKIITIANLLGQVCKSTTTTGHTISIADLPNGNYVATILTPQSGQIAVGKIIKKD